MKSLIRCLFFVSVSVFLLGAAMSCRTLTDEEKLQGSALLERSGEFPVND